MAAVAAMGCALTLGVLPAYAGDVAEPPAPTAGASAPTEAVATPGANTATDPGLHERYAHLIVYTYNDLLGRDPDPDSLASWQYLLLVGLPRAEVAAGITYSHEYRARLVTDAYQRYLGRGPDPAGLDGWVAAMSRGWTVARIGSGFIASDEYYQRSGGTRSNWVTALYRDVLRREPSADEVSAWVRALARGETREQVALGFLLSTEHLATVVDGYYMTLLRRHLDPVGLRGWVALLQAGHYDEEIVGGIVASDEYWNLTAVFPLDRLVVTPDDASVEPGAAVTFAAQGMGRWDDLGDVTSRATFSLDGTPCPGAICSTTVAGTHVVTASLGDIWTAVDLVVTPGPLDEVAITPEARMIADGASVLYAAQGFDAYGNPLGDVTGQVTFAVDGDAAACVAARCRPVGTGDHVVTVVGHSDTVTLTVSPPGPQGYTLWGSGSNAYGRFGDGTYTRHLVPSQGAPGDRWAAVSIGNAHVLAVKTDGSLWGWGANTWCQLGTAATDVMQNVPEQIGTDSDWVSVVAANYASFAVKEDGSLWVWGMGDHLGAGPVHQLCSPVRIGAEREWRSVAASSYTAMAIAADGSLWSWGANTLGQLGDGSTTNRSSPTFVDQGPWARVSPGPWHTLGLKADGTLWAWGRGERGALGTGVAASSTVPVQVGTAHDWIDVAASSGRSYALTSDGTLWRWGDMTRVGVQGPYVLSPEPFDTSRPWAQIIGQDGGGRAIAADGTLWGWGSNSSGQLGTGTTATSVTSPVQAGTGGGWVQVASDSVLTLALRDPGAAP